MQERCNKCNSGKLFVEIQGNRRGLFCSECGKPKPLDEPLYRCDKCGWEPEDPRHPPKFCPECGDVFDDNDKR